MGSVGAHILTGVHHASERLALGFGLGFRGSELFLRNLVSYPSLRGRQLRDRCPKDASACV